MLPGNSRGMPPAPHLVHDLDVYYLQEGKQLGRQLSYLAVWLWTNYFKSLSLRHVIGDNNIMTPMP